MRLTSEHTEKSLERQRSAEFLLLHFLSREALKRTRVRLAHSSERIRFGSLGCHSVVTDEPAVSLEIPYEAERDPLVVVAGECVLVAGNRGV